MAPFESDAEVYETLAPLLSDLVQDAGALAQLRRADAVVQYAFRHPDATITIDVREGRRPTVQTGDTDLRADLVLSMDADVGHRLLSGELSPMLALARGDMRTKGPVAKLLRVVPAVAARSGEVVEEPAPEEVAAAAEPAAAEPGAQPEAGTEPGDGAEAQPPEGEPAAGAEEAPAADETAAASEGSAPAGDEPSSGNPA